MPQNDLLGLCYSDEDNKSARLRDRARVLLESRQAVFHIKMPNLHSQELGFLPLCAGSQAQAPCSARCFGAGWKRFDSEKVLHTRSNKQGEALGEAKAEK